MKIIMSIVYVVSESIPALKTNILMMPPTVTKVDRTLYTSTKWSQNSVNFELCQFCTNIWSLSMPPQLSGTLLVSMPAYGIHSPSSDV